MARRLVETRVTDLQHSKLPVYKSKRREPWDCYDCEVKGVGCRSLADRAVRKGEGERGGVEPTDSADSAITSVRFWDGSCGLCNTGGLERVTRRWIHFDSAKLNTKQGEERWVVPSCVR